MNPSREQVHHGAVPVEASVNNGEAALDTQDAAPRGTLGLGDAVSIIVGIVVGAGIYQTAPDILGMAGSPQVALAVWGIAGVLSLIGALCYAELASTYPRDGGDIVYLSRAFGRWTGFLFGWVQLTVILTGSIGMMAFVFANYASRLVQDAFALDLGIYGAFGLAGGAVLVLTVTNILGVLYGKVIQNILTVAKILGLGAIVVAGFIGVPAEGGWAEHSEPFTAFPAMIGVAFVVALYTYGGWNDAAFVAAEVKDGKKNITRALVLGVLLITVLYLAVNAAYINALGYKKASGSQQIAADVLNHGFGRGGVVLMCALVMISALGAVNGLIFTGARVYSTVGKDYTILRWMGGWNRAHGAPVPALITQGILVLALIFLVGTNPGRNGINWLLDQTATTTKTEKLPDGSERTVPDGHFLPRVAWPEPPKPAATPGDAGEAKQVSAGEQTSNLAKGSFDILLGATAPIFWGFFLLTGIALFVLRERDTHIVRPFRVPFYPELPLIFCISCGYMLYSSLGYAFFRQWKGALILLGVAPLLLGLILYRFSRLLGDRPAGEGDRSS